MPSHYTINMFNRQFPDDAACLEYLFNARWPHGVTCVNCQRYTRHFRIARRRVYSCTICGNHISPAAGTIFDHSSTPLRLWFYAIYLMASTRCEISARQLQRELGVTYKTAWRMFRQIRALMSEQITGMGPLVERGGRAVAQAPALTQAEFERLLIKAAQPSAPDGAGTATRLEEPAPPSAGRLQHPSERPSDDSQLIPGAFLRYTGPYCNGRLRGAVERARQTTGSLVSGHPLTW